MSHNGQWIDAGTDALEAQRKRKQRLSLDEFNRLSGKGAAQDSALLPDSSGRITLAAAAEKYFANCEARGLDSETIRKYVKVDSAWRYCKAAYHDNGKIKPDVVFVNVKQALLVERVLGDCHGTGFLSSPNTARRAILRIS